MTKEQRSIKKIKRKAKQKFLINGKARVISEIRFSVYNKKKKKKKKLLLCGIFCLSTARCVYVTKIECALGGKIVYVIGDKKKS